MDTFGNIYEVVRQVPFGMVTTYGKVAQLSGVNNARVVGYAPVSYTHLRAHET